MAGQLNYSFHPPKGTAGSLYDISVYAIDSRVNEEAEPGVMRFGMGAMLGASPGIGVRVPDDTMADAALFEGVLMTGYTKQMTMQGEVNVYPADTVGVLRWGRAWALIPDDVYPAYGESVYLITDGDDRGKFTNDAGAGIPINATFLGERGTGAVAPIVVYNQKTE